MDSFYKTALWVFALIIISKIILNLINIIAPVLDSKWYFMIGIVLGVLGTLFIQDKINKYKKNDERNGTN